MNAFPFGFRRATKLTYVLVSLITATMASGQDGDKDEILKRFRQEVVEIQPGQAPYPASLLYGQLGDDKGTRSSAPEPFLIGQYEIPQNLWQVVMGRNPSRWKGDRNSVEMLSFDEAVEFCKKLTDELRRLELISKVQVVRMPTELEWEYATRAGTETDFSFGKTPERLDEYGWHTGNAAGNDPPVGAKKPNPWKLYDVHGYLSEYCLPTEAAQTVAAWNAGDWSESFAEGDVVVRGGSWKDKAESLRSGYRRTLPRTTRDDAIGLRCVIAGPLQPHPVADFKPTAQEDIVPANATIEWLWNEGEFTEGPAVDTKGHIYFSDIGNRILSLNPSNNSVKVVQPESGRANGMMFRQDGLLVRCEGANTGGGRRISVGKPEEPARTLSQSFEGKRFNSPNDLVVDSKGRVYFTDPRYVGEEPLELDREMVLLVQRDGTTSIATADVSKPNGIVLSPNGQHAYVADHHPTGPKQLLRFDVKDSGELANKQVLFDFGTSRGIDGMTIDRLGNIYATAGAGMESGIYVFAPSGKPLAFIPTPGAPTNCVFGIGDTARTLYVTGEGPAPDSDEGARKYGIGSIQVKQTGFHIID
jgi:gluconolactonase